MNFMKDIKALLASLDKCSVQDIHIPRYYIILDKPNKHEIQQTQQSWMIRAENAVNCKGYFCHKFTITI